MPTLYVIATPIGNLKDLSPRAVETMRNAGLIIAEDTDRKSTRLNSSHIATSRMPSSA